MMSFIESLYKKSPVFIQNIMVSAYGLKLYRERYTGHYKEYLNHFLKTQYLPQAEIEEYQQKEFRNIIMHCYRHVPYYRNLFNRKNMTPDDFKEIRDLKKLPVLDKETVRENRQDFLAENIPGKKILSHTTSGTTGKSLKIHVDINSRRKQYALYARGHMWAGLKGDHRNLATFGGKAVVPDRSSRKIFWRYNAVLHNYIFSSYHLNDDNIEFYIKKIAAFRPEYIEAYPTSLYRIADYIIENGGKRLRLKAILTSSETLFDYQRDKIEKAFDCKIYDQYGCAEQAVYVSQCEEGVYHVHPEYGLVEILDEDGREVGVGESGQIVCTSFTNYAMPFIRYKMGDIARKGFRGKCGCGRYFPVIDRIYGREDDVVITPSGKRIGRLSPCFKGIDSIKQAQIVQKKVEEIEILLIPGKTYRKRDGESLLSQIRDRIGEEVRMDITLVENIPLTGSGKAKLVRSEVPEAGAVKSEGLPHE